MAFDTVFTAIAIFTLFATNLNRCSSSSPSSGPNQDPANTYLTIVFWHSLLVTGTTPLLRLMYNRWFAHTPLHWLFSSGPSELLRRNALVAVEAVSAKSEECPSSFPYPVAAEAPGIDTAFFLHSIFGLAWLVVGHITLVYSHRWGRKAHRRMGYVALLFFLMHLAVAVYTLNVDVVKHHPLPRIMLLITPIAVCRIMAGAIAAAKRGDIKTHRNLMLRVYLYSTEGAGTIRQVEHFMWMLRTGPGLCQSRNNSLATNCMWSYVLRLILTRMLTQYHLVCVAKLRGNDKLFKSVLREVLGLLLMAGGLCGGTYVMGKDQMGKFLQGGGYVLLGLFEACLPKPGIEELSGMQSYVFPLLRKAL